MPIESLPFAVETWSPDGNRLEQIIARCANVLVAQAAFDAAAKMSPGQALTLRNGARVISRQNLPD